MKQDSLFEKAQSAGFLGKLYYYAGLSGPGWIQAAVTLGGGTLVGALYLGVVGGYQFLWLQPLAMLCGIIMLSAINYVTLSKDSKADRPFKLAERHVSPVLAWGWLLATIIADVVFCAAQFALGTDAIQGNLGGADLPPFAITGVLFVLAFSLIWLFSKEGRASRRPLLAGPPWKVGLSAPCDLGYKTRLLEYSCSGRGPLRERPPERCLLPPE